MKIFAHISQIRELLRANTLKTIIFNFRMLPWRQAIRIPILLYENVDCRLSTGKIIFLHDTRSLHFGDLQIGQSLYFPAKRGMTTTLIIQGTLEVGHRVKFKNGSTVHIAPNAVCRLNDKVTFGERANLVCYKKITAGPLVSFSWDCSVFDTNFHYLMGLDNIVNDRNKEIFIGENCWIGHHSVIAKGTRLNDWTIVASNSLVNKDFSAVTNCIIGGIPSKVIKDGIRRVFDAGLEHEIEEYFAEHPDSSIYALPHTHTRAKKLKTDENTYYRLCRVHRIQTYRIAC